MCVCARARITRLGKLLIILYKTHSSAESSNVLSVWLGGPFTHAPGSGPPLTRSRAAANDDPRSAAARARTHPEGLFVRPRREPARPPVRFLSFASRAREPVPVHTHARTHGLSSRGAPPPAFYDYHARAVKYRVVHGRTDANEILTPSPAPTAPPPPPRQPDLVDGIKSLHSTPATNTTHPPAHPAGFRKQGLRIYLPSSLWARAAQQQQQQQTRALEIHAYVRIYVYTGRDFRLFPARLPPDRDRARSLIKRFIIIWSRRDVLCTCRACDEIFYEKPGGSR